MPVVEVFADLVCPFTHVGLRRFVEHRTRLAREDVTLLVRAWPLEIVNGQPLDAQATAGKVADLRDQVAPDLFAGFDASTFPTTSIPALALAVAANATDARTGERVNLALRDLLFEQGADLTDLDTLSRVAAEHGVTVDLRDSEAVLADHAEGVERGVIGSPHFFTPDGGFFCPALDIGHDPDGHLAITTDAAGFEAFLASCFA